MIAVAESAYHYKIIGKTDSALQTIDPNSIL